MSEPGIRLLADHIREKWKEYDDSAHTDEQLVEAYRRKFYAQSAPAEFYADLERTRPRTAGENVGKLARGAKHLLVDPTVEGIKAVVTEPASGIATDVAMLRHGVRSKEAQAAREREARKTKQAAAFETMAALPGGQGARLGTRMAVNAALGGTGGAAATALEGGRPSDVGRAALYGTVLGGVVGALSKRARTVEPAPSPGDVTPTTPSQALVRTRPGASLARYGSSSGKVHVTPPPGNSGLLSAHAGPSNVEFEVIPASSRLIGRGRPTFLAGAEGTSRVVPPAPAGPKQIGRGRPTIYAGARGAARSLDQAGAPRALLPESITHGPYAMEASSLPSNVPEPGATVRMPSGAQATVRTVTREGRVHLDVEGGGTATLPLNRVRRAPGGATLHSFPSGLGEMIPESVKRGARTLVSEEGARLPSMRSASSLLRKLGPAGKELDRRLDQVEQYAGQQVGHFTNAWRKAGGYHLSPKEDLHVALAREGKLDPATLSPKVQKALAALHIADSATGQAALSVGEIDALRANHLPHRVLPIERLLSKSGNLTKEGKWAISYDVGANGVTPAQSLRDLNSYVALKRLPANQVDAALANGTVDVSMAERILPKLGKGATLREAVAALRGEGKWAPTDPMAFRTTARNEATAFHRRALDLPWIERPSRAVPRTLDESWHAIMDNAIFGKDREHYQALLKDLDPRAARKAEEAVLHSRRPGSGPYGRALAGSRLQEITSDVLLGPDTALKKLVAGTNVLLTSDHTSYLKGVGASLTRKGWDYAHDLGVLGENTPEYMGGLGAQFSKGSNWFHRNVTGITRMVDRDRVIAANAGRSWVERLVDRFLKNPTNDHTRAKLHELLLDPDKIVQQGGITEASERAAVRQYVHLTEHLLTPKDLPPWMLGHPPGRILSQFLHWKFAQGRLLARATVNEARSGNYGRLARNAGVMAGAMLPAGIAGSEAIQFLQGKKGPKLFVVGVRRLLHGTATPRDKQIVAAHILKGAMLSPGFGPWEPLVPLAEYLMGTRGTEGKTVSADEAADALPTTAAVGVLPEAAVRLGKAAVNRRARQHAGAYVASRVGMARALGPEIAHPKKSLRRLSDLLQAGRAQ